MNTNDESLQKRLKRLEALLDESIKSIKKLQAEINRRY